MSEALTRQAFAKRAGLRPAYVRKLANTGRLVMAEDGVHVLLEESLRRIEETKDAGAAPDSTNWPLTAKRSQFADLLGVRPSYVTKLGQQGRLVFTADKKLVKVHESVARIEATKDPARGDVAQRNAATRSEPQPGAALPPALDPEPAEGGDTEAADSATASYSRARARTEHWKAERAEMEFRKAAGELCEVRAARGAGEEVGTQVRVALERMQDRLAPELAAAGDETRVRALLADYIEGMLQDLASSVARADRSLTEHAA